MKRIVYVCVATALITSVLLSGSLPVQAASGPTWNSIIAYFNPNPALVPGTPELLNVLFLNKEDITRRELLQDIELRPYQSGTLYIGNVLNDASFSGSAVISATVPVLAVYKQSASDVDPYAPLLYTSFEKDDSGLGKYFFASVQSNQSYNTRLAIQNVESVPINLQLYLYPDGGGPPIIRYYLGADGVDRQRSLIVKISEVLCHQSSPSDLIPECNKPFSGSVVALAVKADATPPENANIVGVAQEIQGGGRRAYAFEGTRAGSGSAAQPDPTAIYMPSAACSYGENHLTTEFSVQNAGTSDAGIRVDYYDKDGNQLASSPTVNVAAGYRNVFKDCDKITDGNGNNLVAGRHLSAVIHSSNGQPIAAVAKTSSDDGLMTAYTGIYQPPLPDPPLVAPSVNGKYRIVLPYVDWDARTAGYRTNIFIQNASGAPASDITVWYYSFGGEDAGPIQSSIDHIPAQVIASAGKPLAPYARIATSPSASSVLNTGTGNFTGGVIIWSDQPIAAIARVTRTLPSGTFRLLGDDYSGLVYDDPLN